MYRFLCFQVNRAIDDNDDEFFTGDGEKVVRDCFKGVLKQNKDRMNLVPPAFRRIVEEILGVFEWPDNKLLWQRIQVPLGAVLFECCDESQYTLWKPVAQILQNACVPVEWCNSPWCFGYAVVQCERHFECDQIGIPPKGPHRWQSNCLSKGDLSVARTAHCWIYREWLRHQNIHSGELVSVVAHVDVDTAWDRLFSFAIWCAESPVESTPKIATNWATTRSTTAAQNQ